MLTASKRHGAPDHGRGGLWLVWSPREGSAPRPRELADDEVVGVFNQVGDHLLRYRPIGDHGVPMPLVEVISREHRAVILAQLLCDHWFALGAERTLGQAGQREHFAGDLEDRRLRSKRECFLGAEKALRGGQPGASDRMVNAGHLA